MEAVRSSGAGGQNVNKVSSAIHLRFDIPASSLPQRTKDRLLALRDSRINREGVLVIKAQQHRTREKNRQAALSRLTELVRDVMVERKPRVATQPGVAARRRRMDAKSRRGKVKALRQRPPSEAE